MKSLRKIAVGITLCLILAMSVFAGQVESPGSPAAPPAQTIAGNATSQLVLLILGLIHR